MSHLTLKNSLLDLSKYYIFISIKYLRNIHVQVLPLNIAQNRVTEPLNEGAFFANPDFLLKIDTNFMEFQLKNRLEIALLGKLNSYLGVE